MNLLLFFFFNFTGSILNEFQLLGWMFSRIYVRTYVVVRTTFLYCLRLNSLFIHAHTLYSLPKTICYGHDLNESRLLFLLCVCVYVRMCICAYVFYNCPQRHRWLWAVYIYALSLCVCICLLILMHFQHLIPHFPPTHTHTHMCSHMWMAWHALLCMTISTGVFINRKTTNKSTAFKCSRI